jgi:hypothetical protein
MISSPFKENNMRIRQWPYIVGTALLFSAGALGCDSETISPLSTSEETGADGMEVVGEDAPSSTESSNPEETGADIMEVVGEDAPDSTDSSNPDVTENTTIACCTGEGSCITATESCPEGSYPAGVIDGDGTCVDVSCPMPGFGGVHESGRIRIPSRRLRRV